MPIDATTASSDACTTGTANEHAPSDISSLVVATPSRRMAIFGCWIDPVGQLAMVALLASCVYAIEAPHAGWRSAQTITLFGVAAAALVVLLNHESRRTDPLIELRFFRSVPFTGATLVAISAFGAFAGFVFLNTLYLQTVRGLSPLQAGLCTLPLGLAVLICSPMSGRMVGAYGPRHRCCWPAPWSASAR